MNQNLANVNIVRISQHTPQLKLDIGSPQQIEHEEKSTEKQVAVPKKIIHSSKDTSNG